MMVRHSHHHHHHHRRIIIMDHQHHHYHRLHSHHRHPNGEAVTAAAIVKIMDGGHPILLFLLRGISSRPSSAGKAYHLTLNCPFVARLIYIPSSGTLNTKVKTLFLSTLFFSFLVMIDPPEAVFSHLQHVSLGT